MIFIVKSKMEENNNEYYENLEKELLFEQCFGGCSGLEKEKKEYFYNCLNAISIFDDYELVNAHIEKREDCFLIKGSIYNKTEKAAFIFNCELYEEKENKNLYYTEIKSIGNELLKSSMELFTRKDDTVIHELSVKENKIITLSEYNIKDLNFVENKKNELIKKISI